MAGPLVLRAVELKTHALLRVRDARDLLGREVLPAWVEESLERAPWVVVRRALPCEGRVPVGVRGSLREQRFAAWVSVESILEHVTPQALVCRKLLSRVADRARVASIPALAMLDEVGGVLEARGLGEAWGPAGSVGFELASGVATVTTGSDLDLVIEIDRLESFASDARALWVALAGLGVRVDALLETPHGAVVLSEYAQAQGSFVLRTLEGPRLARP
jgi:phosphoribosyl-dephospho-CoA transferase